MVKQNASTRSNRPINEYKMRTSYGASPTYSQTNQTKHKRVEVAKSTGCCSSSKKEEEAEPVYYTRRAPPPTERYETTHHRTRRAPPPTERYETAHHHSPTAHERSHIRNDPPDPFYYHQGRVKKTPNRNRDSHQNHHPQYGKNQVHSSGSMTSTRRTHYDYYERQPVETTKKSSCCTIL